MALELTKPSGSLFGGLSRPGVGQTSISSATQDARALQQNQMVSQATKSGAPISTQQLAEAGTAQTEAIGKEQVQATADASQGTLQGMQSKIQNQGQANQQALRERALGLQTKDRELQSKLYSLNSAMAGQLFEEQMKFQKDELGRSIWQTRQLVDWSVSKAKSDEDLANFEQKLAQEHKRKMQVLQTAHAKISQSLQQEFLSGEQNLDQEHRRGLIEAKNALEKKMQKQQNDAKMWSSIITGAGTIVGGIAGSVIPVVGTAGGAVLGGGIASAATGAYYASK
jgi:hypothetical protein